MRSLLPILLVVSIISSGCVSYQQDVEVMDSSPTAQIIVEAAQPEASELIFSGDIAFDHIISQVDFGPRYPGTAGAQQIRDYITQTMSDLGWLVERQSFTYNDIEIVNIIASAPVERSSYFVLGAHYDTRIYATEDKMDPQAPVIGANDGASGVAVLLELARTLDFTKMTTQPVFVFFDAEDNGGIGTWQWIIGSAYYVGRLQSRPSFAVIVDMVGDTDQQLYFEANSDEALRSAIWATATELGYADTFIDEVRHSMLDDHTPFLQQEITAVDIIDFDYPYWHTTQDTVSNVSAPSLERVGRTLEVFLETSSLLP